MITDPHERLIQDVLEGDATPAQAAELARLLETNPEMRARHDEMREVFRLLAETPAVAPPPGLHEDIMRAIAQVPAHGARRATSGSRRTPWPMLGAFLAGATAATLVVVSIVRGPETGRTGPGNASTSGTMAPVPPAPEIDRQSFAAGGGRVEIVAHRAGDQIRLDVHVRATQPVDLECVFAPEALGLTGVSWSHPLAGHAVVNTGHVTLAAAATADCSLSFLAHGAADAPITVHAGPGTGTMLHTASGLPAK